MPLPIDGPLSLQNNLTAGTSAQAAPKRAMIVRMSQETLEALEDPSASSQLEFDFGTSPGIYIGSTFFPVQCVKETTPHELFLRTIPAGRTSSSLRLQANVIGKLTVTERNLQDKVGDRLRETASAQIKEREEKRTPILFKPPPLVSATVKKTKGKAATSSALPKRPKPLGAVISSPAARRGPQQPIQAKDEGSAPPRPPPPPVPDHSVPSPAPPPVEPPKPLKNNSNVRTRLVHCLAAAARKRDDASRLVIGPNPTEASQANFLELLSSVAEPNPALRRGASPTGSTVYQLKSRLWTEIRPWTWGKLLETERRAMAERACDMFTALNIPDDDPRWEHVRPRPLSIPSIPSATSSSSHPPKLILTPAPPKQDGPSQLTKPKPRPVPVKTKVDAKDESQRSTPTTVRAKTEDCKREEPPSSSPRPVKVGVRRERERDEDPPPQSPALSNASVSRRPPGTSVRVIKRESPVESGRSSRGTPQPPPPSQAQVRVRKVDVDPRSKREESASSSRNPLPPQAKDRERDREKPMIKKRPAEDPLASDREMDSAKRRKLSQGNGTDREGSTASSSLKRDRDGDRGRERDRRESAPIPRRNKARDLSPPRKISKREDSVSPPPRKIRRNDSPPPRKARRSVSPSPRKPKRSPSPPPRKTKRSPSPPPRKSKRETSPLLPRKPKREPSPPPRPAERPRECGHAKTSGSTKRKRVSTPTFTSDEEEEDDERPARAGGSSSAHEPASSVTSTSSSSRDTRPPPRQPRMPPTAPLPRDRGALEDRYSQAYDEYIQLFSLLSREKTKIKAQLRGGGGGATGASEDEDAGFLSEGELRATVKRFEAWTKELGSIREAAGKISDKT